MAQTVTYLTPQQLAQVAYGSFKFYENQGKTPETQNLEQRPLLKLMEAKMKKNIPFIDNVVRYNTQLEDDSDSQEVYGRGRVQYNEDFYGEYLEYDAGRIIVDLELVHDELRANGFDIMFQSDWKTAPKLSKSSKLELANILTDRFDRKMENYNRNLDEALHRDGTGNTSFVGLFGLFPTDNTTGSIGGITRADNVAYRHVSKTGLNTSAIGSGGNLRKQIDIGLREAAKVTNRGRITHAVCGGAFLDGVKDYTEVQTAQTVNTQLAGVSGINLAMPDKIVSWSGPQGPVQMIYDPTLDRLADELGDASIAKRAYWLNTDTICLLNNSMHKRFSRAADEYDLFVSRFLWMGDYTVRVTQPSANMVTELA